MTDADRLLRQGDLEGARAALAARARIEPAHAPTRMFLFQLLSMVGEWDKARGQLDILARLSPEAQMLAVAYGQAIDAERVRASALAGAVATRPGTGSEIIPVLARGGDWIDGLAHALMLDARGEGEAAQEARGEALDAAPDMPGLIEADELGERRFDWIADADPRFGPSLEAVVGGRWGLLPFDAVERITSKGVRDLRDAIWFPAEVRLRAGGSVAAMLPARYPGSERSGEVGARTGAATYWNEAGRGLGQRVLALSGGEEFGLLSLRSLRFDG